jgi:hypothetical protein
VGPKKHVWPWNPNGVFSSLLPLKFLRISVTISGLNDHFLEKIMMKNWLWVISPMCFSGCFIIPQNTNVPNTRSKTKPWRFYVSHFIDGDCHPITLILNTPIAWSPWNVEIPYIHYGF